MSTFIGDSTYTRAPPTHRSPLRSNNYMYLHKFFVHMVTKFVQDFIGLIPLHEQLPCHKFSALPTCWTKDTGCYYPYQMSSPRKQSLTVIRSRPYFYDLWLSCTRFDQLRCRTWMTQTVHWVYYSPHIPWGLGKYGNTHVPRLGVNVHPQRNIRNSTALSMNQK